MIAALVMADEMALGGPLGGPVGDTGLALRLDLRPTGIALHGRW